MDGKCWFKLFVWIYFICPVLIGIEIGLLEYKYESFMHRYEAKNFDYKVYDK